MDRETSSTTQYKPVTVDVPEDRLAEFHAFFRPVPRGPSGPRSSRGTWQAARRPASARAGRCAERREPSERSEPTPAPTQV